jgi:hypothetical protein
MRKLIFLVVLVITFAISHAQNTLPETGSRLKPESPWRLLNDNKRHGLYLKAYLQLIQNPSYLNSAATPLDKSSYYDVLVQLYNYFGEYKKAGETEDKFLEEISKINGRKRVPKPALQNAVIDSFTMIPAIKAIEVVAGRHQVIMINEEHRATAHRQLTIELLPILYKKGFRYLALEDLDTRSDTLLNKRKYPIRASGSYVHDPIYGEMVRKAIAIGFKVVGYDFAQQAGLLSDITDPNPFARDNIRDSVAAKTIINTILKSDPKAKILVHAGRAHIGKIKWDGLAMMAWHFREYSGITPFSIDQVHMSGFYNAVDESPVYQYAKEKYKFKTPVVFSKNNRNFWTDMEGYDMTIFTPPLEYNNDHALWLLHSGQRKIIAINFDKLGIKLEDNIYRGAQPLTIQVFYKRESNAAIPAQQILLLPGEKVKTGFALLKGNYEVVVKNEEDVKLAGYDIKHP